MDSVSRWSYNHQAYHCGYGVTCMPVYTPPTTPVRGVCPYGWHLPTTDEWQILFTAVGGQSTAGKVLKSTSGWMRSKVTSSTYHNGNGSDAFSFSALPAGYRDHSGLNTFYFAEGQFTYFWSSKEEQQDLAYCMGLNHADDDAGLDRFDKRDGYYVRCLKD